MSHSQRSHDEPYDVYALGQRAGRHGIHRRRRLFAPPPCRQRSRDPGRRSAHRRANRNLRELEPKRTSGGSAANTMIAAQAFGCRTFYTCKVADDDVGRFFLKDLATIGVATNRQKPSEDAKSGRCLVLITPDAERIDEHVPRNLGQTRCLRGRRTRAARFQISLYRGLPEFFTDWARCRNSMPRTRRVRCTSKRR